MDKDVIQGIGLGIAFVVTAFLKPIFEFITNIFKEKNDCIKKDDYVTQTQLENTIYKNNEHIMTKVEEKCVSNDRFTGLADTVCDMKKKIDVIYDKLMKIK